MLNFLRKNKDSLFIKILLGALALAFIIFFGSGTMRDSRLDSQRSPASVNGKEISGRKASLIVGQQVDQMRQQFGGKVPDSYLNLIRNNVVENLINQELIEQNLSNLGVTSSAQQMRKFIKENPQFQINGEFNKDYYLNKFLPGYKLQNGSSFETDIKKQLAIETIISELDQVGHFTSDEHKLFVEKNGTQYKFSVIKIKAQAELGETKLPKEITDKDLKETSSEGLASQKKLASKVFQQWKSGQDVSELLNQNKLKVKKTPWLPLHQLKAVFDGQEKVENLKQLAKLNSTNTFPKTYFKEGGIFYLVKLDERKSAKADELKEINSQMTSVLSNTLQSAWLRHLKQEAEIVKE